MNQPKGRKRVGRVAEAARVPIPQPRPHRAQKASVSKCVIFTILERESHGDMRNTFVCFLSRVVCARQAPNIILRVAFISLYVRAFEGGVLMIGDTMPAVLGPSFLFLHWTGRLLSPPPPPALICSLAGT